MISGSRVFPVGSPQLGQVPSGVLSTPAGLDAPVLVYPGKRAANEILAGVPPARLQELCLVAPGNYSNSSKSWVNQLIWGDNLPVLQTLLSLKRTHSLTNADGREGPRLIYIDIPFASQRNFESANLEPAYSDRLVSATYLEFIRERLILAHALLSEDGTLFCHLDEKMVGFVRVILDEIFGPGKLRSQITWRRHLGYAAKNGFENITDQLLYYTKSEKFLFRPVYQELSVEELVQKFPLVEPETGRRFRTLMLETNHNTFSRGAERLIAGRRVVSKLGWTWSQEKFDRELARNPHAIYWTETGRPRYKSYADEYPGRRVTNLWNDILPLNTISAERVDYPTQKPEALLERVINACSNKGDLVLDFFSGSGTTLAVAEKLGRRWIGVDSSQLAITTSLRRMLGLRLAGGDGCLKPFLVSATVEA